MRDNHPGGPPSSTMLPVLLSAITLFAILVFLVLISGGFFLYVLCGVVALFLFGLIHYVTWGAALQQSTEGEREELRLREQMDEFEG